MSSVEPGPATTSAGTAAAASLTAIRTLMLAFEGYRNQVARFYGLSVLETQTVSHLVASGELGPTELGQRLGVTPGSVTALLDRLTAASIVERRPHPSDRRRAVVSLSPHGWDLISESARWFQHALDGIEESALPDFVRMLEQVAGNMDRQRDIVAEEQPSAPA